MEDLDGAADAGFGFGCFGKKLPCAKGVASPKTGDDFYYVASIDFLPGGAMEDLDGAADAGFGFGCFDKLPCAKGAASPKTGDMTKEAAVIIAVGTLSLACAALYVGKKSA